VRPLGASWNTVFGRGRSPQLTHLACHAARTRLGTAPLPLIARGEADKSLT